MTRVHQLNVNLSLRSAEGALSQVIELLSAGANPLLDGSSLQLAARHGHVECLKILLPLSDARDNESLALRWAATNGHLECVRLLIPASDARDCNSLALRRAAGGGHVDCVLLLLPDFDPTAALEALCEAAKGGHADCVGLLLQRAPSLLRNPKPLNQAIEFGQAAIVSLMLEYEPSLSETLDSSNLMAIASRAENHELAALFSSIIDQKAVASATPAASNSSGPARL